MYDEGLSWWLAERLIDGIVYPFIELLETGASFLFIAIAIYAFFRMVSASWDEEKVKWARMSIFYSIVWFLIVRLSRWIVDTLYWDINCGSWTLVFRNKCNIEEDLSDAVWILVWVINWINTFVWIISLILIIYAGYQVIFWANNEENLSKAKKSILYIALWIWLLVVNYLILTFFLLPESTI